MEHLSPSTRAVLTALAELGQGNVHELADKSGKARSTTDKAIKTLADAGLIVAVDLGPDPAEGTPARWTLSEAAGAQLDAANLSDEPAANSDTAEPDADAVAEPDTGDSDEAARPADVADTDRDLDDEPSEPGTSDQDDDGGDTDPPAAAGPPADTAPTRPGDRKVMAIKGVLADHPDGAKVETIVAESGISHPTTIRLLAAMQQADAARRLPGMPERWITGPTKASEVDPSPEPPRCPLCQQVIRGVTSTPSTIAALQPLIRPDQTVHVVGPDEQTHIVTLPTRAPVRTPAKAGAASRSTEANADGHQPLERGELEKLTIAVLTGNPGKPMTPQQIAAEIGARWGRTVSSGAVRNNCTKAAAAGNILLAAEAPLTFVFPPVPGSDHHAGPGADRAVSADSTDRPGQ